MKLRSIGAIAATVTLCIGVFANTANVANARPQPDGDDQTKYKMCVVTLAPLPVTKAPSRANPAALRVASRTCADRSAKEGNLPSVEGSVPLIEFYQHSNYEGDRGRIDVPRTCREQSGGWVVFNTRPADLGFGNWGTSSWRAFSECWHTTIYYGRNRGAPSFTYNQGTWRAASIGAPFNDHVWSIWTRYS